MKKEFRVRKNEEFSSIIAQKHSLSCASFVLYISDKRLTNCRVGISVSKKLGNAVIRNKIKRQVREMVASIIDFKEYPYDCIIIVRIPYLSNNYQLNLLDLEKMVKKAIIKKYEKGEIHE